MKYNIFTYIILLFLIICLCCCVQEKVPDKEKQQIYEDKGYNEMKKERIKPELFKVNPSMFDIVEVNIPNTIAGLSKKGEFVLIRFDDTGILNVEPIVPGFPKKIGELFSDNENNFIWLVRGRGLYALDIETGINAHAILGNYGKTITTFVIDPEEKIMGATTLSVEAAYGYHIINLKKGESTLVSALTGTIYPFYDNFLLLPNRPNEDNNTVEWGTFFYDFRIKRDIRQNKLTKALTKYQMEFYSKSKTFHLGKRIMIGTNWIEKKLFYYTITWDEEIEDVKIEPFTIQKPKNTFLDDRFRFSANGNWVKSTVEYRNALVPGPELIIYHVQDHYPQNLSPPIYCGYTNEGSGGGFMMHDQWGPCYVEHTFSKPDILMVYKLKDGLEILKNQAIGMMNR